MGFDVGPPDALPPVWLVTGEAGVLVDGVVEALLAAAAQVRGGCERLGWRGADGGVEEAIGAARTPPFLDARRLVLVRDLEAAPDRFFDALEGYLASPSPQTILVLAGRGFPKVVKGGRAWGQRIPKLVGACGRVVAFADKDVDPIRFVLDAATSRGLRLGRAEAQRLVEVVGGDLGRLALELEKVALWVDEGAPIDAAAIDAACSALAEDDMWALANALQRRDGRTALVVLHRALDDGQSPEALFAQVTRPLRLALRASERFRQGWTEDRVAAELRVPARVARDLRQAPGRPSAELLERLARAQRAMHGSRAGAARVLEDLVLDLVER